MLIRSARDRRAAWAALRVGCATTLARAGQRLQRAGAASIRVLRSGTQGSDPAAAQHAGGDASTVGSLADATSRGIASLARSVLTLPGGPSTVLAGAVAVLGLAAFAWLQPAESDRVQMRPFVVEYAFDYRAELPPNLVYEQRELRIGDPIFLGVIDAIDVTVNWSVPRGDVAISGGNVPGGGAQGGGGGGGAGEAGKSTVGPVSSPARVRRPGAGGDGLEFALTGSPTWYGGGGGGGTSNRDGADNLRAVGGKGGGGVGAFPNDHQAENGAPNTGGGGGGGSGGSGWPGGAGGSGVVIVRYAFSASG